MTKKTKEAFLWIIKLLHRKKIPYQITGGFAARLYGSKRPLADIDLEIPNKDITKILPEIENYILKGPKHYKDHEFDIYGVFLKYKGQKIDVCGISGQIFYDKKRKKWIKQKIDLNKSNLKKVYGLNVHVVPLKNLIAYKRILSRRVDKIDIKNLTEN